MSNEEETIVDAILDVERKLDGIDCILENVDARDGQIALDVFGNLIESIYVLLWESIVINLHWLFEKPTRKESRGLHWFIDSARKSDRYNKKDDWDVLEKELGSAEDLVSKTKMIRNKWLAHRDKRAAKDPVQFIKKINLELAEVRQLKDLALKITSHCFLMHSIHQFDVHKLFWAVEFPTDFAEAVINKKRGC